MFFSRRNRATRYRSAFRVVHVRPLVVESLENRRLLASIPCVFPNSADFVPRPQSATSPCFGHLSAVASDERFDDLPFGVQTIAWHGKPTTVIAGQWIVKLKDPVEVDNFTSTPTSISLDESNVVTHSQNLGSADTWVVETEPTVEPWQIIAAIGDENIDYIEPNFLLYAAENIPNDPDFNQLWGLRNSGQTDGKVGADVSATSAWEENTGSRDVIVASLDSGIDYNHVDLAANVWRNPNEVPDNGIDDDGNGFVDDTHGIDTFYGDSDPIDRGGHGTHTSGTLGAVGNNGIGISGVAWDVQIMPLKFLADSGIGRTDAAIAALNYMTMMKRDHGVNIVASNNSWFGGDRSQALEDAIANSIDAGIVFVAAAGNDRRNNDTNPTWPATYPLDGIIAVASTDDADRLAKSSHYGPTTVDLAAPGVRVYSTLPDDQYGFLSGTSMATPHVTGAVALLKSVYPGASPAQVKSAILSGTDPIAELAGKMVSGGRLNIARAFEQMGFFVNATTPATGEIVFERPSVFVIEMSHAVDVSSVEAADLTVNDISADHVEVLSDKRLRFSFLTSPVTVDGVQQMRLAAALERLSDGTTNEFFESEFRFDSLLLEVAATRPASAALVQTPWTMLEIDFNEPIDPTTVDVNDLRVSAGQVLEATVIGLESVRYVLSPFINEQILTFEFSAGAITDFAGNPNASFVGELELDYGTVDFPAPWSPVNPLGTLAAERALTGLIDNGTDTDIFRLDLKKGQQISVVADVTDGLWPQVELLAETGEVISMDRASGSGQSAVIAPFTLMSDGEYRVRMLSANATIGAYHLSVLLNAGFESESVTDLTNNSFLTAEDLSARFVAREHDVWQAVVLGRSDDSDNYLVQINPGDSLSVALATELPVETRLELLDTEGRLQAVGVSSGRFSQVIDEFVGPDGVYNLRVAEAASNYTLVVTRNGSFDNGGNDVTSLAQSLDADLVVSGFISGPPLASAGPAPESDNGPLSLVLSDPELAAAGLFEMQAGEWLIAFDASVSLAEANARLQAREIAVLRELPLFHAALVEVDPSDEYALAGGLHAEPWVRYVEPNHAIHALGLEPNDPRFVAQWALESDILPGEFGDNDVAAADAWSVFHGDSTVVVAVIDTGVDLEHVDLVDNLWKNPGEIPDNGIDDDGNGWIDDVFGYDVKNQDPVPSDDNGHGTHLAGIVGAVGDNGLGIAGVNWDVSVLPIKALDADRQGTVADVLKAIEYMVFTKGHHNLRLTAALTSWTTAEYSALLEEAIDFAHERGILFVAAAGNDAVDRDTTPTFPANTSSPGLLAVTATGRAGDFADFAAFGEKTIHLAAPGEEIYSTLPGDNYGLMSGTSASAAYVAGAVALLAGAEPTASVDEIRAAILAGVDRSSELAGGVSSGGRLNLLGAMQALGDHGDFYRFHVVAGDTLTITTLTPDGSDSSIAVQNNALNPAVEIYDSAGHLIAQSAAGSDDGINVRLELVIDQTETYTVRVLAETGFGAYVLRIGRSTDVSLPFEVLATNPHEGEVLGEPPQQILVHLSDQFMAQSLNGMDFQIDGQSVSSVAVDGNTLALDSPLGLAEGVHTISAANHDLVDVQGNSLIDWQSHFELDFTGPRIELVTVRDGEAEPDGLRFEAAFSEPLRFESIDVSDVRAVDAEGNEFSPQSVHYQLNSSSLTVNYEGLTEGAYTLILESGDGGFEDAAGNDLDGEPLGNEAHGVTTGDGVAGGNYSVGFTVDHLGVRITDWERRLPLGSQALTSQIHGGIYPADDRDEVFLRALPGEIWSAFFHANEPGAELSIVTDGLVSRGNQVVIPPQTVPPDGTVLLSIESNIPTSYEMNVFRNSAADGLLESDDPISLSATARQLSVAGFLSAADVDEFEVDLSDTPETASIDVIMVLQDASAMAAASLEIVAPDGQIVATGTTSVAGAEIENVDLAIRGVTVEALRDSRIHVSATSGGDYQLLIVVPAQLELEPNDTPRDAWQRLNQGNLLGYLDETERDLFFVDLMPSQSLLLTTSTPLNDSPGQERTALDPRLLVYDADGNLLTSDDESGPGANARLLFTSMVDARYRVAIQSVTGEGEYELSAEFSDIAADFDEDHYLGCGDLSRLQQAISEDDRRFDITSDNRVDVDDLQEWILNRKGTLPGDANLDFVVDGSDLNIWNDHKFRVDEYWCSGDFTGDGVTDASDLNIWLEHRFTGVTALAIPAATLRTPRAPLANSAPLPTRRDFHETTQDRSPRKPIDSNDAVVACKADSAWVRPRKSTMMSVRAAHRRVDRADTERDAIFAELVRGLGYSSLGIP